MVEIDLEAMKTQTALQKILGEYLRCLRNKKRPAIFATDDKHRVSEHCDAVPWSVIEEVLK